MAPLFAGADTRPDFLTHVMGTLLPSWQVDVPSLRVPLFVALGRHDYVVPHTLWRDIPAATVRVFPRSGHQPFCEEPEEFASAVAEWVA